jgi:hypothetical protein
MYDILHGLVGTLVDWTGERATFPPVELLTQYLEVTFLFPWAVSFKKIGLFGFWSMMVFLFILTIGFVYEWKKGALDWE